MRRKRAFIAILFVLLLLVAQVAYAMSSANYRIDWTNLLTGSGGHGGSGSYIADVTVGQTASKVSSSASYQVSLGYWTGSPPNVPGFLIHLPLVRR
jgi:hypothetical protein